MAKAIFVFLISFSFHTLADELDAASSEALNKTKQLMNSPDERQAYIKDHADAQAADKKVNDVTGGDSKTKDQMYNTAGDIYDDMVKKTGGDSIKQKQFLDEANKDPEAFYNGLTPDQQNQIRDLAGKMQQNNPMNDSRY
jgi:hypothetical protein